MSDYQHRAVTEQSVVYPWASRNLYWESYRQQHISKIGRSKQIFADNSKELVELGAHIRDIGLAERQKERLLLEQALPSFDFSNIDDKQLIEKINEVIQSKSQYEAALERIHAAIQLGNEGQKNLGPSLASVFLGYLATEINANFTAYAKQLDIQATAEEWTAYFNANLDKMIDRAMERMLTESQKRTGRKQDNIYGDADTYRMLYEVYKNVSDFRAEFQAMLKSQLQADFNKITKDLGDAEIELRTGKAQTKRNSGFSSIVRGKKGLDVKTKGASIGGFVNEFFIAMREALPKEVEISDAGARVFGSNVMKTDSVSIYDWSGQVNAQNLVDQLDLGLRSTLSLKDAAQKMEQFYNQNLKNLDKTFLVYTNAKNYSLGSGFAGFHGGTKLSLNRLPDYIAEANINANLGMDFVYSAYNAMQGAIYEDEAGLIQEQIEHILMAAASHLLFDDWSTIGEVNTGAQQIHVLNLSGVVIPSSYLFIKLGEAMMQAASDMRSWFSVKVHLPTTIVYNPGDWQKFSTEKRGHAVIDGIYNAWDEQFKIAEKEAYFTTKFLFNFKKLIANEWT